MPRRPRIFSASAEAKTFSFSMRPRSWVSAFSLSVGSAARAKRFPRERRFRLKLMLISQAPLPYQAEKLGQVLYRPPGSVCMEDNAVPPGPIV